MYVCIYEFFAIKHLHSRAHAFMHTHTNTHHTYTEFLQPEHRARFHSQRLSGKELSWEQVSV